MKKFITKNWFNIVTLFISAIALSFAFRGNQIAQNAVSSNMEVVGDYRPWGSVIVTGCLGTSNAAHQLYLLADNYFMFMNRGGRTVSLMKAKFSEGNRYYDVRLLDLSRNNSSSGQELELPIDIEAGTGRIWYVSATYTETWNTVSEALNAINFPNPQATALPETQKPFLWQFEFSDGSVVVKEYKVSTYNIQPNIDIRLQESCSSP